MHKTPSKWLASIALAFIACVALTLPARAQTQLAAGRDYAQLNPALPTENPAKVEVIEFFSFACPHCADLNPTLVKWVAKLPADVAFKRLPVGFNNPFYQLMARFYYTLEAIGELSRLDAVVFDALHNRGIKLIDKKSLVDWVSTQGVDAKKFSDAFDSFGVDSKAKRADQVAQAAKIQGVPALLVDGRYLVIGQNLKTHDDLLALTDKVIAKARAEHKK